MSTETIREAVRADGGTVRLTRTSYATLAPTWCLELSYQSGRGELRTAVVEADADRAFDRLVSGGAR